MISGYAVADVRMIEDRVRAGLAEGELMARAADGLAEVVAQRVVELGRRRIVVLVGPGDNGGDALSAAALLARRPPARPGEAVWGEGNTGEEVTVEVITVATAPHPGGLALVADANVSVHEAAHGLTDRARTVLGEAELIVDGLLGIGGRPGLSPAMAEVVARIPAAAYVIAVDLPSGADPEGLAALKNAVYADETVTFGVAKPVHLLPATRAAVGRLTVVDIGLGEEQEMIPVVRGLEPRDVASSWPVPGPEDDKYSRGVLGIIAGSQTYPGAAVLSVTAAVESGVGMVRYVGPSRATDLVLASCPEVVPGMGRVQAWMVGSGVDPVADADQVEQIEQVLREPTPVVVDAGAISVWAELQHRSAQPVRPAGSSTLLTPHAGELARLLTTLGSPADVAQVRQNPVRHARVAAELTGCTVLLKGHTTLVAEPEPHSSLWSQSEAPSWLATAGAGDVLAGLAGMLMAAGLPAAQAGAMAAWVHGRAAHRVNPGGPVRALVLAQALPGTIADLLTGSPPAAPTLTPWH